MTGNFRGTPSSGSELREAIRTASLSWALRRSGSRSTIRPEMAGTRPVTAPIMTAQDFLMKSRRLGSNRASCLSMLVQPTAGHAKTAKLQRISKGIVSKVNLKRLEISRKFLHRRMNAGNLRQNLRALRLVFLACFSGAPKLCCGHDNLDYGRAGVCPVRCAGLCQRGESNGFPINGSGSGHVPGRAAGAIGQTARAAGRIEESDMERSAATSHRFFPHRDYL